MKAGRYERIKEILIAAGDLPPAERPAFLEGATAGDPALRAEVESLLAQEATPAPAVQSGALAGGIGGALRAALDVPAPPTAPERIGRYRIFAPLGEGGMGEVFRAEQSEPIRRVVALKLVRRGLDSREFVRRFETERQILARLEHPGIARLIDGGLTEDGVPWFTMEFVDGIPLDRYCDQHALPVARRLRLFLAVCEAVQFAHRNLIVHRDLKPGEHPGHRGRHGEAARLRHRQGAGRRSRERGRSAPDPHWAEADSALTAALASAVRTRPETDPQIKETASALAALSEARGDPDRARRWRARAGR